MTKNPVVHALLISGALVCGGCATTSVKTTVEGLGPVGDRLLVKRDQVTLSSNPWNGSSVHYAPPEFFLCGAAPGANSVQCEPVTVQLPEPK